LESSCPRGSPRKRNIKEGTIAKDTVKKVKTFGGRGEGGGKKVFTKWTGIENQAWSKFEKKRRVGNGIKKRVKGKTSGEGKGFRGWGRKKNRDKEKNVGVPVLLGSRVSG